MKKLIFNPLAVLFFTILAVIFSFSLRKTRQKNAIVIKNVDQLTNQVKQLRLEVENSKHSLADEKLALERERIIRDELLMKKEGEIVFQLPQLEATKEAVVTKIKETKPIDAWKELLF